MSGGPLVNGQMMSKPRHSDGERTVKPSPVSDKSYVESFVNIIHDISNAYKNQPLKEEKEVILWIRMFSLLDLYKDYSSFTNLANKQEDEVILLALGYTNGIQIWDINDKGSMTEILSLRQGPVKSACILPPPSGKSNPNEDLFAPQRPLLAMSLAADRKELFTSVSIVSLRNGSTVYTINFKNDIDQLHTACDGVLIVTLLNQIYVYSTFDFSCLCTIDDCYVGPKITTNPIAIGSLWMAYCPKKLSTNLQSCGGLYQDGTQSYTATVINAAKTVKKGISTFGDTVQWLALKGNLTSGDETPKSNLNKSPRQPQTASTNLNQSQTKEEPPGVVTVVNLSKIFNHPKCKNPAHLSPFEKGQPPSDAIVAHFVAYYESPLICMQFSPSGMLLATADKSGHTFNIFTILPHPLGSKHASSHHVYKLYRGDTSAKVQNMVFSVDSRWLTVSTHRGTSHLFPISTYGGAATQRTHLSHCVVNRTSRFHKSAGLEEMDTFTSMFPGHTVSSTNSMRYTTSSKHSGRSSNPSGPTVVNPIHQIHSGSILPNQTTLSNLTNQASQLANISETKSHAKWQADTIVASLFTTKHLTLAPSESSRDLSTSRLSYNASSKGEQCLLLMTSNGEMSEYHIHPHQVHGITKVTDESPIDVMVTEKFRWPLHRLLSWNERSLPLPLDHPVMQIEINRQIACTERLNGTTCDVTTKNLPNHQTANNVDTEINNTTTKKAHSDSYIHPLRKQYNRNYYEKGRPALPGVAVLKQKEHRKTSSHMQDRNHSEPYNRMADVNDYYDKSNGIVDCDVIDSRSLSPANEFPAKNIEYDEEWLSQVEIVTHEGPARRLWMGPQFSFKTLQSTGSTMHVSSNSSALLSDRHNGGTRTQNSSFSSDETTTTHQNVVSDVYVDDLDLNSIKILNNRSDPVPTPNGEERTKSDNSQSSIPMIEAGSGSFDQHGHMLEIGAYGSLEDRRYASLDGEERLRERLADAMQEQVNCFRNTTLRNKSGSSSSNEFATVEEATHFQFDSYHPSLEMPQDQ